MCRVPEEGLDLEKWTDLAFLFGAFPGLKSAGVEVTSPPDDNYNCMSWSVCDTDRYWWPEDLGGYFWPDGISREETKEAFIEALSTEGYSICEHTNLEPEWEKAAVYARENGTVTHVARQLPDGRWTSKMAEMVDFRHGNAQGLEGEGWGRIVVVMRRQAGYCTRSSGGEDPQGQRR